MCTDSKILQCLQKRAAICLAALLWVAAGGCAGGARPVPAPADPPPVWVSGPPAAFPAADRVGILPFDEPGYAPESGRAAAEAVAAALDAAGTFPEIVSLTGLEGGWAQNYMAFARERNCDLVVTGAVELYYDGSAVAASRVIEQIRLIRAADGKRLYSLKASAAGFPAVQKDVFGGFHRTAPASSTRALFSRNAERFAAGLARERSRAGGDPAAAYRSRIEALTARAEKLAQAAAREADRRRLLEARLAEMKKQVAAPAGDAGASSGRRTDSAPGAAAQVPVLPQLPIRFEPGSSTLTWEAKRSLYRIAEALKARPECRVRVEGHSDRMPGESASAAANWRISTDRALAVRRFLEERGRIDPARMCASGYGAQRPAALNDTPENRALNRRVEIIAVPADPPRP